METPEHQEWRSRQQLSLPAVIKTTFIIGLILFVMSGGTPWSTAGTMNMIMGRDIPAGQDKTRFFILLVGHLSVSFVYTYILGLCIYRFKTFLAIPVGIAVALALYFVNEIIFRSAGLTQQSPVFVTIFVHAIFGLFAALVYKAISVPAPLEEA